MHLFFAILLGISCLFLGCAYHPPIDEIPQYGYPEISMDDIKANPLYQKDLAYAQRADSTHEAVNQLIAEGFARLEHEHSGFHNNPYIIESFNRAWLLDSLNPHIYMGFALYEMADWNNGSRKKAPHSRRLYTTYSAVALRIVLRHEAHRYIFLLLPPTFKRTLLMLDFHILFVLRDTWLLVLLTAFPNRAALSHIAHLAMSMHLLELKNICSCIRRVQFCSPPKKHDYLQTWTFYQKEFLIASIFYK